MLPFIPFGILHFSITHATLSWCESPFVEILWFLFFHWTLKQSNLVWVLFHVTKEVNLICLKNNKTPERWILFLFFALRFLHKDNSQSLKLFKIRQGLRFCYFPLFLSSCLMVHLSYSKLLHFPHCFSCAFCRLCSTAENVSVPWTFTC